MQQRPRVRAMLVGHLLKPGVPADPLREVCQGVAQVSFQTTETME
jgi:hypothetical protein